MTMAEKLDSATSAFLDSARWISALLVVLSHLRNIAFVDYAEVEHHTFFVKVFYFITGMGHQAVVVFFVLSGFLVGGLSLPRIKAGTFSVFDYCIHRFSRIYTVFIPALLCGWAIDSLGISIFGGERLYGSGARSSIATLDFSVLSRMSITDFCANLIMAQPMLSPPFGSNGALWSLSYEWWYYMLFAAGAAVWLWRGFGKVIPCALIILFVLILPFEMLAMMFIWWCGAGANIVKRYSRRKLVHIFLSTSAFILCLIVSRAPGILSLAKATFGINYSIFLDGLLGLSFSLLLHAVLSTKAKLSEKFKNPSQNEDSANSKLADFSYSLYLVHLPFLVFCISAFNWSKNIDQRQQPTLEPLFLAACLLISTYIYAFIFSKLFEARTGQVRAQITRATRAIQLLKI